MRLYGYMYTTPYGAEVRTFKTAAEAINEAKRLWDYVQRKSYLEIVRHCHIEVITRTLSPNQIRQIEEACDEEDLPYHELLVYHGEYRTIWTPGEVQNEG